MDLLIEQDRVETKLSSFGLFSIDVKDTSPTVTKDRRSVKHRNGYLPSKLIFNEKQINVSAYFYARNQYEFEEKKDDLNRLLMSPEAYFITKMIPTKTAYGFELPGQTSSKDLLKLDTTAYKYRYQVTASSPIAFEFRGLSGKGLLYQVSIAFETDAYPFGMTKPKNETVTGGFIRYDGTTDCSQLEWPWYLKMTGHSGSSNFYVTVGKRRFDYKHALINATDTFLLKGTETTLNGLNVNDKTNYEHFVLTPEQNKQVPFSTDFKGKIELINKVEFYV